MAKNEDDAPLGLGNLFRLAQQVVDNARADGTDYSRVLTDTLESLEVELKTARGVYSSDRENVGGPGEAEVLLVVPTGQGRDARLVVDGEDLLRRLPVRRLRLDVGRERATLRVDLAPGSVRVEGRAAVVDGSLRDASRSLMFDWSELDQADDDDEVRVPASLMKTLREELGE